MIRKGRLRRTFAVPGVRSLTDGAPPAPQESSDKTKPQQPIDRAQVQHLDPVRATYRPTNLDGLAPRLKRLVGREDVFRRVGEVDLGQQGMQALMQCPPHWPVRWVPIGDLEILEILEDQDIRAG